MRWLRVSVLAEPDRRFGDINGLSRPFAIRLKTRVDAPS